MSKQVITLVIVDDDTLIANLLADFLNSRADLKVLSIFNSGSDYCEALGNNKIVSDIVILDLKMADGDGTSVLDFINVQQIDIKTIVLTSYFRVSYSGYMFKMGAHAFLPKETEKSVLVDTIRELVQKQFCYSAAQLEVIKDQISYADKPKISPFKKDDLSAREVEVLTLLCQQLTAKQIASKLYITNRTVESHKSNLLSKTGAKNTIGLILYAIRYKLIDPDSIISFE